MNPEIEHMIEQDRRALSRRRDRLWLFPAVVLIVLLAALASEVRAQTITFTAETTTGVESVTPVLTWSTDPVADACFAGGDWSGSKGPSGTETLPPVTQSATYNLTCEWDFGTATLSWTPPTTNTDGSALTDLAGYRIYYSTLNGGPYDSEVQLDDPGLTSYVVEGLSAGTWYFVGTAVNELGIESEWSNQAQKDVLGAVDETRSVGITVNARPSTMEGLEAN